LPHHQSDGGRTSRRLISLHPACASESAPPSELFRNHWLPRANAAARRRVFVARRQRPLRSRDTVRAGNDRASPRSAADFFQETTVTAYLIALALAGLIAIVTWEAL
jgi:hypothetical protein